jgi:ABC-type transport system involved in cytochrome c biogenesis permease subunit
MGIFTGTEVLFYWLGIITTLLVLGLVWMQKKYNFKWYSNTLAGFGIFLLIFAIAWSVSSILEAEPQAANMGIVFFGLPALLCLGITYRLVATPPKAEAAKEEKTEDE